MSDSTVDAADALPGAFDHHSPQYAERSHEILAALRQQCPVTYTPSHGGYYVATKYDDVAKVMRDDSTFSSEWRPDFTGGIIIPSTRVRSGFIEMDPPRSLEFRRAAMKLLSRSKVEEQLPMVHEVVTAAIDDIIEDGECDLVNAFSHRVPGSTTMRMLGMPEADWKPIAEYFHELTSYALTQEAEGDIDHGSQNPVMVQLRREVRARREHPLNDGVTAFIESEIDGRLMDDEEAAESVHLLFLGGFETTSSLLANSLLWLSEHPDARVALRSDPRRIPIAVEEFLRYFTPVQNLARTVQTPVCLSGVDLESGERLLMSIASANLDEEEFPQAESVQIDRFPNRHQSFGLGTHRCIGSHFARAQAVVAIEQFITRIPDYRVDRERSTRYPAIGVNDAWLSMYINFTPRNRQDGTPLSPRAD